MTTYNLSKAINLKVFEFQLYVDYNSVNLISGKQIIWWSNSHISQICSQGLLLSDGILVPFLNCFPARHPRSQNDYAFSTSFLRSAMLVISVQRCVIQRGILNKFCLYHLWVVQFLVLILACKIPILKSCCTGWTIWGLYNYLPYWMGLLQLNILLTQV